MEIETICKRIKERRAELNMTQKDLADAMHVSNQLISKWETGESVPSIEYIAQLAEALQISVQSLMGLEEAKPAAQNEAPAQSAPSAPAAPKPKKSAQIKTFWNKNRKPLIISLISVASALFLLAVILLSVFVFAPLANKRNYLDAIDKGIDRYLEEYDYFNIRNSTETDGDEDTRPGMLQGYVDKQGNVAYYNSTTGEIVKDGMMTYSDREGQKAYERPANIKTTSDLLRYLLPSWTETDEDDALDVEKYLTYIRKTGNGYYLEFSKDYLLHDLKPSEIKNIKFTDKIKGTVVMDGKKTKSLTVTVKFRDTRENEKFSIVNKTEFLQTKPVIAHKNYVDVGSSEPASLNRLAELMNGKLIDSAAPGALNALQNGSLRCDNGYVFSVTEYNITVYDPNTLQVKETYDPTSYSIKAATIYNNAIWYVRSNSSDTRLQRYDLNTEENEFIQTINNSYYFGFNGKYFFAISGIAYDLEKQAVITTADVRHVDKAGIVYCYDKSANSLYQYGSGKTMLGDTIYKEENGFIYTRNSNNKTLLYQYKAGEYQKTVTLPSDKAIIQGNYSFDVYNKYASGSWAHALYDLDGNIVADLSEQVALKTEDDRGYVQIYPKILGVWKDMVFVGFVRGAYSYTEYFGFYRLGEWDSPVAHTEIVLRDFKFTPAEDGAYLVIEYQFQQEDGYSDTVYAVIHVKS